MPHYHFRLLGEVNEDGLELADTAAARKPPGTCSAKRFGMAK